MLGLRLSRLFGLANILLAPMLGWWMLARLPGVSVAVVIFTVGGIALAGAALAYAAGQKMQGNDIGHKAFPATWVAWCFFVVMTYRLLAGFY